MLNKIKCLACIVMLLGCGATNTEITVNLDEDGNDFFGASELDDVIFVVRDEDDAELNVLFPAACADGSSTIPTGCGFDPASEDFRLNLDLFAAGASLTLEVRGRDDSGTTLFSGMSERFGNNEGTTSVFITLAAGE